MVFLIKTAQQTFSHFRSATTLYATSNAIFY